MLFRKPSVKPVSSTQFSEFIRNASSAEKKRVYKEVLEKATESQNRLLAKWSDRAFDDPKEIKGVLEFARTHRLGRRPLVTTRSKHGLKAWDGVEVEYTPTALHCYTVAKNTLEKTRLRGGTA